MTHLKSKRDKLNLSAYSTKAESETKFVNTSGDKTNGVIGMQCNKITNLPIPSSDNEAGSKKYVDDKDKETINKAKELIRYNRPLANHMEPLTNS